MNAHPRFKVTYPFHETSTGTVVCSRIRGDINESVTKQKYCFAMTKTLLWFTSLYLMCLSKGAQATKNQNIRRSLFSDWTIRLDETNTRILDNSAYQLVLNHGGHDHNDTDTFEYNHDQFIWKVYEYNQCPSMIDSSIFNRPKALYSYDGTIDQGPFGTTFESHHEELASTLTLSLNARELQDSGMLLREEEGTASYQFCVRFELLFDATSVVNYKEIQVNIPIRFNVDISPIIPPGSSSDNATGQTAEDAYNSQESSLSNKQKTALIAAFGVVLGILVIVSLILLMMATRHCQKQEQETTQQKAPTADFDKTNDTKSTLGFVNDLDELLI